MFSVVHLVDYVPCLVWFMCHLMVAISLFCHFVVDDELTPLFGKHFGRNVVGVLSWVERQLKGIVKALDVECFQHHYA